MPLPSFAIRLLAILALALAPLAHAYGFEDSGLTMPTGYAGGMDFVRTDVVGDTIYVYGRDEPADVVIAFDAANRSSVLQDWSATFDGERGVVGVFGKPGETFAIGYTTACAGLASGAIQSVLSNGKPISGCLEARVVNHDGTLGQLVGTPPVAGEYHLGAAMGSCQPQCLLTLPSAGGLAYISWPTMLIDHWWDDPGRTAISLAATYHEGHFYSANENGADSELVLLDPATETGSVIGTWPWAPREADISIFDGKAILYGWSGYGTFYSPRVVIQQISSWKPLVEAPIVSSGPGSAMGIAAGEGWIFSQGANVAQAPDKIWHYHPYNAPPTVQIVDEANPGKAGVPAAFAADGQDSDGAIDEYRWNFGDGGSATGATATHTYSRAGTYTVSVTVTDNEGATASDAVTITVTNPPPPPPPPPHPNQAPTSAFTTTPGVLSASFTSTATDPDGDPLTHTWTFGDGATSTETNPTHQYAAAGSYNVKLVVNDGQYTAEATQTITVTAPTAPVAAFTLSASIAVEGTTITAASTTIEGSGLHSYTWLLDGTQHASGASTSFNPGVGTHTVKLVVRNEYDQFSEAVKSFTVTAKPADPEPTPTPTPTQTQTSTSTPTESPHADADKESPAGLFLIPALLGAALLLRRR